MNRKEIFNQVKDATVAIVAMNNQEAQNPFTILGSGFCIDPTGRIVTCRHVVEAFMEKTMVEQREGISTEEKGKALQKLPTVSILTPFAVFYATKHSKDNLHVFPCQVLAITAKDDYDIAIMQIQTHATFSNGYPFLEIEEYDAIAEGDEIGTCGFPLGNYLQEQLGTVTSSFTTGIISSIIPSPGTRKEYLRGFQLGLTATHGNSGGPVFSLATGKVFGVLQGGVEHTSGSLLQGLAKAEPVYPILTAKMLTEKSIKSGSAPI